MIHRMRRRGPDAEGLWAGDGVVLGHRRLAILDLAPRANQPMLTDDGRYAIVFNGEIYNFRELRDNLVKRGTVFHTTSDTEVLLALYASEGEDMLRRLRGMFAFAIWDARSRLLFLARDPYGIKPLYYARISQGVLFASQVKALLASGRLVSRECEPAGLAGFYLWGSVPEPWTLYRDVFALPAGHWLHVHDGVPGTPVCWHDIRVHWQEDAEQLADGELRERVRDALTDSVRAHLVSDVPVSVFLSGGVDSAVVAALARESGAPVAGITVGFEEFAGRVEDEVPAAADRTACVARRIRPGRPSNPGGNGSTVDRRRKHLVRQQSGSRTRLQGCAVGRRRRRTLLRLLVLRADSADGRIGRCRDCDSGDPGAAARAMRISGEAVHASEGRGPAVARPFARRGLFPPPRLVPATRASRVDGTGPGEGGARAAGWLTGRHHARTRT
jgi:hypothetical protein